MNQITAVITLVIFGATLCQGQDRKVLETKGWGSLSGKVTLDGKVPPVVDLTPLMKKHPDWKICLDQEAKPIERVDATWVVNPKTKAVANVVVWLAPPAGKYFPIHPDFQKRTDHVEIDQPHCAFVPRVSVLNPVFFDGTKKVPTGQKLILKNSSPVARNLMARSDSGSRNDGFAYAIPARTTLKETPVLHPQATMIRLVCTCNTWMRGSLYVFDHPYYAITKEDGTFSIPIAPVGAEMRIVAHHETAWVFTNEGELKYGRAITLKEGNNSYDFEMKAP